MTVNPSGPGSGELNPVSLRAIAFYLPQFHPIPENDTWWGKGFTEWTNVARAQPLFRGHYQPHIPADLGFYDLRLPETREAQAELARRYGLHGFCYYHYWFEGKRLLERPFNEVLQSNRPAFPFCLCWANESWSRRWLGEERAVLIKQTYSPEDDRVHARWLCRAFADPRYIRVRGRPVFLIYRPTHLPHPAQTLAVLRDEAVRAGLPNPWLVGVDARCPGADCRQIGCDATMQFQPQLGVAPSYDFWSPFKLGRNLSYGVLDGALKLIDDSVARLRMARLLPSFPVHPCCFVSWDNSPRRGPKGTIFIGGSPEGFQRALRDAAQVAHRFPEGEGLLFINGWNEWAEGNHLEPDQKHGHGYLEAVRSVVSDTRPSKRLAA